MRYRVDLELLLNCLSRICRDPGCRSLVLGAVNRGIFCVKFLALTGLTLASFEGLIARFRLDCSLDRRTLARNMGNMVF